MATEDTQRRSPRLSVEDVMTHEVVTAGPDTAFKQLEKLMASTASAPCRWWMRRASRWAWFPKPTCC